MKRTSKNIQTKKQQKSRVLLIHTGGTFGMEQGRPFLTRAKSSSYLGTLLSKVPELEEIAKIDLEILCNLDSSDVTPVLWKSLAEKIAERWQEFDGFVVIHGTDTMAYTATALSFFLSGLSKPVVLTGSQRPLSELRTDARANIIDSIELATLGLPEVMICFDSKVHRGTRVTKYSNEHLQAFRAHNSAPLGNFGVHFSLNKKLAKKPLPEFNRSKPTCDTRINADIISFDCVPGYDLPEDVMTAVLKSRKGIVLRGFGVGNLPLVSPSWLSLCEKALAKKVPVVMASQCSAGRILLDAYENGRKFKDAGVISSSDMSYEACVIKLMVMLGRNVKFDKRHEFFATPLANECTSHAFEGGEHA